MSARKNIFRLAGTLLALSAGIAFLSSCRVPPSPPPTANGSTVPISYAFFSWKDQKDFMRISEFFTDEENLGGKCVLRTDEREHEEFYFSLAFELFEKIPEGGKATLNDFRPDRKTRSGLYFILALDLLEKIPEGSKAVLRYFRPDRLGEQSAAFELPEFSQGLTNEIWLGLTGDAWPSHLKKERPTAWQISVIAPDGKLLVYRESFLWALPKK